MKNKNFDWLDRIEYPFTSQYFSVDRVRMHYIDEGVGETILFVHGTPSWSFDFRNVIKELKKSHRCIAVDHIGFGLSDKPEHYDYSTQNHSATLEKFILDKNLNDITLVVHDFGGPIGLNFAERHPDRVKRIVVLNSWLWSSENDPEYKKMRRILRSPVLPFLYRYLNFSARFVLPASFGVHKLSKKLKRQYTAPFANPRERNGTLAFAKSLLNDQQWFESLWQRKNAIAEKPVLFIWGMKDPVIRPKYLEKFCSGFKNSTVVKLEDARHFPQEENAHAVAAGMREWIWTSGVEPPGGYR